MAYIKRAAENTIAGISKMFPAPALPARCSLLPVSCPSAGSGTVLPWACAPAQPAQHLLRILQSLRGFLLVSRPLSPQAALLPSFLSSGIHGALSEPAEWVGALRLPLRGYPHHPRHLLHRIRKSLLTPFPLAPPLSREPLWLQAACRFLGLPA